MATPATISASPPTLVRDSPSPSITAENTSPPAGTHRKLSDTVRAGSKRLTVTAAQKAKIRDSRVNVLCVHPGGIKTRIAEQSRLGDYSSMATSPKALHAQFDKMARTSAPQAAAVIVKALQAGKTRVLIGADARIGDLLFRLVPTRASAWLATLARRQIARRRSAAQR